MRVKNKIRPYFKRTYKMHTSIETCQFLDASWSLCQMPSVCLLKMKSTVAIRQNAWLTFGNNGKFWFELSLVLQTMWRISILLFINLLPCVSTVFFPVFAVFYITLCEHSNAILTFNLRTQAWKDSHVWAIEPEISRLCERACRVFWIWKKFDRISGQYPTDPLGLFFITRFWLFDCLFLNLTNSIAWDKSIFPEICHSTFT